MIIGNGTVQARSWASRNQGAAARSRSLRPRSPTGRSFADEVKEDAAARSRWPDLRERSGLPLRSRRQPFAVSALPRHAPTRRAGATLGTDRWARRHMFGRRAVFRVCLLVSYLGVGLCSCVVAAPIPQPGWRSGGCGTARRGRCRPRVRLARRGRAGRRVVRRVRGRLRRGIRRASARRRRGLVQSRRGRLARRPGRGWLPAVPGVPVRQHRPRAGGPGPVQPRPRRPAGLGAGLVDSRVPVCLRHGGVPAGLLYGGVTLGLGLGGTGLSGGQRGISLEHIRRDRILHEALATGADPLHLAWSSTSTTPTRWPTPAPPATFAWPHLILDPRQPSGGPRHRSPALPGSACVRHGGFT